jgi:hypothetical protein
MGVMTSHTDVIGPRHFVGATVSDRDFARLGGRLVRAHTRGLTTYTPAPRRDELTVTTESLRL